MFLDPWNSDEQGGQVLIVAGGAPEQAEPDALVHLRGILARFSDRAVLRVCG